MRSSFFESPLRQPAGSNNPSAKALPSRTTSFPLAEPDFGFQKRFLNKLVSKSKSFLSKLTSKVQEFFSATWLENSSSGVPSPEPDPRYAMQCCAGHHFCSKSMM